MLCELVRSKCSPTSFYVYHTTLNYAGARLRDPSALHRTHRRSSRQHGHTSFRAWWFRQVFLLWVVLLDVLNQQQQTDENTFQAEGRAVRGAVYPSMGGGILNRSR